MTKLTPSIILSDLGAVLLFPKDRNFKGKLNPIYAEKSKRDGFNFFDYFELDNNLLDYYHSLKNEGVAFYMITEGVIQNAPEIKGQIDVVFNNVFSGKKLGMDKKDPELYTILAEKLRESVENILFIDDAVDNISAASKAGMKTILYKGLEDLKLKL